MSHRDVYQGALAQYLLIYLEDKMIHAPVRLESMPLYLNNPDKYTLAGSYDATATFVLPKEVFLSALYYSDS